MEQEEIEELEEQYADDDDAENCIRGESSDDAYERWRDDEGDRLQEVLTDTFNMFVKPKSNGYYKGNSEKWLRHSFGIMLDFCEDNTERLARNLIDEVLCHFKFKIVAKGKEFDLVDRGDRDKQSTLTTLDRFAKEGLIEVSK